MKAEIKAFPKGPLGENTYLIKDEATGHCVVIDPGYYGSDISDCIGDKSNLKFIILTHGHFDHFYSANDYIEAYPEAKFIAPLKDMPLMQNDGNEEFHRMGIPVKNCPPAHTYVTEEDVIKFEDSEFTFLETPGHTIGSMCILLEDIVFSGDTLFRLSVGNTSFETGDWNALVSSIHDKIYTLDENMIVLPGHGAQTSVGYEKRFNPFV